MRTILLSTPTRGYTPNYIIPAGILSLAAYLEQHGHEVRVVDAAALREPNPAIVSRVQDFAPDLIGIGGIITAYSYIINLSRDLKKAMPKIPIVLGGQVVINNVDNCFRHMEVDYLVHGYGEIALEKLVRHVGGNLPIQDIPGVSYRNGVDIISNPGREFVKNINDLPLPSYHLVDMEYYATVNESKLTRFKKYLAKNGKSVRNFRFLTVMGTLGCTDRCTFCVHEQEFMGLKIFSNDYLLRHIKYLHETYNINIFAIGEEMFISDLSRAREFNDLMKINFPKVYWSASTRANHITPELVAELETGNCYQLVFGFESGSQKMLNLLKKRVTRDQNIRAYSVLDQSKLVVSCSLMIGSVGENNNTIKETIDAVKRARIGNSTVFFATPYPGGRLWDWAVERGVIKDAHQYLLNASDKDASGNINANLTPYPNFILKCWQQMVTWASFREERHKEYAVHDYLSLAVRAKKILRAFLGHTYLPVPLVKLIVNAYFLYYSISRKTVKSRNDGRYEYHIDKDGALLPDDLKVGCPQRYASPEQISSMLSGAK